MILAIKCVHNLPPHRTLHKNWNATLTSWSIWHLGPYSSEHQQSHWPVANTAACTFKGKGMSLQTPNVIQPHNRLFPEPFTRQIGFFQNHSHYWYEDNISFPFLQRWGGKLCTHLIAKIIRISHANFHCNRLTTVQDIQHYASLIFWDSVYLCSTHWWKPHDCTVISFDLVPACDRQMDGHAAYHSVVF